MVMTVRGELNIINGQVIGSETKIGELISDFNHAFNSLNYKIDQDDLKRIMTRFNDFVPFTEYHQLTKSVGFSLKKCNSNTKT